jgi:hypothetical protein
MYVLCIGDSQKREALWQRWWARAPACSGGEKRESPARQPAIRSQRNKEIPTIISTNGEPASTSLLRQVFGSERAAEEARRRLRLHEREARDRIYRLEERHRRERYDQDYPTRVEVREMIDHAVTRERQRFAAELPRLVEEEVYRILADQLPEAVQYLIDCGGSNANGRAPAGR